MKRNDIQSIRFDGENRRSFLKGMGSVGGLAAFGINPASASYRRTGDQIQFAEVSVVHDVDVTTKEWEEVYLGLTITDRVGHYVDVENDAFHVLPHATDAEARAFEQRDRLAYLETYRRLPVTEFKSRADARIVTDLGSSGRPIAGLELAHPYSTPPISVGANGDEVTVSSPTGQTSVPLGAEKTLDLPEQQVEARVLEDNTVADASETGRPSVEGNEPAVALSTETLTAQPRAVVRNYGTLDVLVDPELEYQEA